MVRGSLGHPPEVVKARRGLGVAAGRCYRPARRRRGTARAPAGRDPAIASLLERGLRRVRRVFWRTTMERSHERWVADRGDERLRLDYPLDRSSVVLDVGGYEGRWAEQVAARFGCDLHVFEPVPAYADAIEARLGPGHGVTVHRYGLAGRDGEVAFTLAADGSSALRGIGTPVRVPMRAAAGVFDELGLVRVDLMKVNIEGGEYELLEHLLDRGLMPRIVHLQVQFHDFVPRAAARMDAILTRLAATHAPAWRYPFIWESWTRRSAAVRPAGGRPSDGVA
jgi:FkbM family methyltransferase